MVQSELQKPIQCGAIPFQIPAYIFSNSKPATASEVGVPKSPPLLSISKCQTFSTSFLQVKSTDSSPQRMANPPLFPPKHSSPFCCRERWLGFLLVKISPLGELIHTFALCMLLCNCAALHSIHKCVFESVFFFLVSCQHKNSHRNVIEKQLLLTPLHVCGGEKNMKRNNLGTWTCEWSLNWYCCLSRSLLKSVVKVKVEATHTLRSGTSLSVFSCINRKAVLLFSEPVSLK